MHPVRYLIVAGLSLAGAAILMPTTARDLSFEERLHARDAVERFYHAHRLGAPQPFESSLSRAMLAEQVRDTLALSAALDRFWSTPVTSEMLRRESERIARRTHLPERLQGLREALGNDEFIFRECVARAALVQRLARSFFRADERIHGAGRTTTESGIGWDAWWREARERYAGIAVPAVTPSGAATPGSAGRDDPCPPDDTWDVGALLDAPERLSQWPAVWTGNLMLLWGSGPGSVPLGYRYDPLIDEWTAMSSENAPSRRGWHTAIWSGTEMIVWGGNYDVRLNTGGRYDPVANVWTPTSTTGAPDGRSRHSAVWTGIEMIVWGGSTGSETHTGGRYDPVADSWTPTSTTQAPSPRQDHTAVWTGTEMIVWGGANYDFVNDIYFYTGGRYDPAADTWAPTRENKAPAGRASHTAVWTGSEMIVWGGHDDTSIWNDGKRYDPGHDRWTSMSDTGTPSWRYYHTAVWTGSEMIVWGGVNGLPEWLNTGGRYDPSTDDWLSTAILNAPASRQGHAAVWAGERMVVWGGHNDTERHDTGGRYDPATDTWTPTSRGDAPRPAKNPSTVWTGSEMIVWGGDERGVLLNTGSRYDPLLDRWAATAETGAPSARSGHAAAWTGERMFVWGGSTGMDGGLYDPVTDTWTPTATAGAPPARSGPTAVWTGREVIVWGGDQGGPLGDGGRYDPNADTWSPVSLESAPAPRQRHTAVWTGFEMIVWGGRDAGSSCLATGARYDPGADAWTPTATADAPAARDRHTAVWTGDEMIVWGGYHSPHYGLGGRYDPDTDSWTSTAAHDAGSFRQSHTAVWTGREMIFFGGGRSVSHDPTWNTGGRYDPETDSWQKTSTSGAPVPRHSHGAAWTGDFMLVWGGWIENDLYTLRSGSRYSVDNDSDGTPNVCDDDDDGDGITDATDCAPGDPGAATVPGEVAGLGFDGAKTGIVWSDAAPAAGTDTVYDLARGMLSELPAGSGTSDTCIARGVAVTTATDPDTPDPDQGFWYLVRGRHGCGAGTYGAGTGGVTRHPGGCP